MGEVLLRAADLAERTGLSERFFQKLAKSGKIADWASQPGGANSPILFEEAGFIEWYENGRAKQWRRSTGAASGRGRGRRSKAWSAETPLTQHLREKLRSVSNVG
jgi:hypothetical protein